MKYSLALGSEGETEKKDRCPLNNVIPDGESTSNVRDTLMVSHCSFLRDVKIQFNQYIIKVLKLIK